MSRRRRVGEAAHRLVAGRARDEDAESTLVVDEVNDVRVAEDDVSRQGGYGDFPTGSYAEGPSSMTTTMTNPTFGSVPATVSVYKTRPRAAPPTAHRSYARDAPSPDSSVLSHIAHATRHAPHTSHDDTI